MRSIQKPLQQLQKLAKSSLNKLSKLQHSRSTKHKKCNKDRSNQLGFVKEQQAKRWLQQQGVNIISENFHCRGGEIDLIGLEQDSQQKTIIFVEVKYRKNELYGHPAEFVSYKKQQHLIHCAQSFLQSQPQYQNYPMRFDVICFQGQQQEPQWLINAFGT